MGEALSYMVDGCPYHAASRRFSAIKNDKKVDSNAKLKRRMPSVQSVLDIPGRDLRTDNEREKNVAERGHIIGLEVAAALMRATAVDSATAEADLRELVSLSISGPDNYVITSHALNMRYFKGEQDLVAYIDNYSQFGEGDPQLKTDGARYVSHFIMEMHTRRLKPLLRGVGQQRTSKMVDILQSVLG